MKKLLTILIILGLVSGTYATQQSVSGNASGWTVAATDTLILNGNATIDGVAITCTAFWIPAGQTYTLAESGTSGITVTGNGIAWKDSSTGTKTYPDSIAMTGNGRFLVSGASGTITNGNTALYFSGADTLSENKTGFLSGDSYYKHWRIGTSLYYTGGGNYSGTKTLRMENSSTFNIATNFVFFPSTTGKNFIIGSGCTIIGGVLVNYITGAPGVIDTLPLFVYTGSGDWDFRNINNSGKFIMSGNISFGTVTVRLLARSNPYLFNCNGYNLSCGDLQFGADISGDSIDVKFGSGTHTIASFAPVNNAVTGLKRFYLETSTINCGGNWTIGTNHTPIVGTGNVTITNNSTVTTKNMNPSFYDFAVNGSGKTVTVADSLLCSGDVTVTAGTLVAINKTVRCVDYTIASGATIRDTGSLVYISGNAAFGNTSVKTKGTGKYVLTSGNTHTFAAGTGNLKFDSVVCESSTSFTGSDSLKLRLSDGVKVSGGSHVLLAGYDFEGSTNSKDTLSKITIDIPEHDTISNCVFDTVTLAAGDTIICDTSCRNLGGNSGNIIFPPNAPTITDQPDSIRVIIGTQGTFSVSATGSGTLSYQWRKNGANVGTNSSTYTTAATTRADTNSKICVLVSDFNGTAVSDTALMYVKVYPIIDSIRPIWQRRGAAVKLRGNSFMRSQGTGYLTLGGTATNVGTWTDSFIVDTIPATFTPRGTHNLIIWNSDTLSDTVPLRVLIPEITGGTPP